MSPFDELPWLNDVVLRTISGYFDGPLNGLAEYQGRLHWYAVRDFDFENEGTPDEFVLYELSDADIERETRRRERFRELVGTHTDLDEAGKRRSGALRDESTWGVFYAEYPPNEQPSYRDHQAIGRFRARTSKAGFSACQPLESRT